jgi:hypothetical protein
MDADSRSICIRCGQSANTTTRFNRLEDGSACPTCLERLLQTLAPALPGFVALETVETLGASSDRDPDQPA